MSRYFLTERSVRDADVAAHTIQCFPECYGCPGDNVLPAMFCSWYRFVLFVLPLSGMFREGEKHGAGSLLTAEGDTLEGEWVRSRAEEGDVSTDSTLMITIVDRVYMVPLTRGFYRFRG